MTDLDHGADLRERLDHALADLAAPDGLTEGVLTDGRRLRRRRRIVTGGAGLAAAAVVTVVVVASLGGSAPSTDPGVATEPPAPKVSEKITGLPSSGPANPDDPFADVVPEGWWDAPADLLLDQLTAALPDGVVITDSSLSPEDRAPGEPEISPGWLHATLTGPEGPGGFEILLYPPDLEEIPDPITTADAAGNEQTQMMAAGPANRSRTRCGGHQTRNAIICEEILNGDGVTVGRVNSLLQDGTITFYEATLLGPDGGLVYMSAWNAVDVKPDTDTPASANVPPLSLDQMGELVQDPSWTSYTP